MTQQHDDTGPAFFKVLIAWLGTIWGSVGMQDVVLTLTAVYTVIQIYVLVRDKIVRPHNDDVS